ncbi:MAG: hypothetical protein AB1403_03320 [Candidatus Riflebacteria bacterium]
MKKLTIISIIAICFSAMLFPAYGLENEADKQTTAIENTIKTLLKKIEKYPDDYFLNVQLGWNYYLVGKYANSIHHYGKALQQNQWSFEPRMGFYNVYMAQMEYEKAESACRSILGIDPINYFGSLYLSRALSAQGKNAEAKKVLLYILTFFPSDPQLNEQYIIIDKEKK